MSGNLLEMVRGHLGEASVSRIGSLLGQSSGTTHSAINKGLPVLLGGSTHKGSTREGAEELSRHLDHVDDLEPEGTGAVQGADPGVGDRQAVEEAYELGGGEAVGVELEGEQGGGGIRAT